VGKSHSVCGYSLHTECIATLDLMPGRLHHVGAIGFRSKGELQAYKLRTALSAYCPPDSEEAKPDQRRYLMPDPNDAQTLWLNVTNITLGIATALCILAVCGVALREVAGTLRRRALHPARLGADARMLQDIGITMAGKGLNRSRRMDAGRGLTERND